MKFYSATSDLKYTWDQVAQGLWRRYPNPYSKHVTSEDTVERFLTPDNKLYSKRLITKTSSLPKWGARILGFTSCSICVLEESIINLRDKSIITYTRNIGMTKVMSVTERCLYTISPDNYKWTSCQRQAWITSGMGHGLSYAFQAFGLEKFKNSAVKTVKGFEHVLSNMYSSEHERAPQILTKGAEKVKAATKKATAIAKSKAAPMVASCAGGDTAG